MRLTRLTDLVHSYGGGATPRKVLEGINLRVADGELVSIVGPSGCGKTTPLRSIVGLLRPGGGTGTLNGTRVEQVPDGLAVVFQDYSRSLFPWLTVRDNVALPLRRKGMKRAERRGATLEALGDVGLDRVAHRYPWQL